MFELPISGINVDSDCHVSFARDANTSFNDIINIENERLLNT